MDSLIASFRRKLQGASRDRIADAPQSLEAPNFVLLE
jgi:hypothetical protein